MRYPRKALRFARRMLVRQSVSYPFASMTLILRVGANRAIFSLVDPIEALRVE